MKDGIDRRAFMAELETLDTAERGRRARAFASWTTMAAKSQGWRARAGLLLLAAGLTSVLASLVGPLGPRPLIAIGIVLILIGQWLSLHSARGARRWRVLHPFEEWRRAMDGGEPGAA